MKWVYELIAETVPPFKWLPPVQNVLSQLMLMYGAAIFLFYSFNLEGPIVTYAFVGAFVVAGWSLFMLQLAPTIRGVECHLEGEEKAFLDRYRELMFHPRHYELYLGFAFFFVIAGYLLFLDRGLMTFWFGPDLHPVLLFFVLTFTFDVAYRSAVVVWVSALALWRSVWLKRYIERRQKMEYTPYTGLRNLRELDLYAILFVVVSLPVFPTIWTDRVFVMGFILQDGFILVSAVLSVLLLRRAPWLPPDIYDLVYKGKFSYIGTLDEKKTPHVVPTSYIFDGMNLFFMSSVVSKKLRNIKQNERIAFLIDERDPSNLLNNKAVLFTGRARIYGLKDLVFHPIKLYNSRRIFKAKYSEYAKKYEMEKKNLPKAWQLTPITSRTLVGVVPEKIVYWRKAEPVVLPM